MANSNILAIGTTQASSSTFAVVAGSPVTLALVAAGTIPLNADAIVEIQSSASNWASVGSLAVPHADGQRVTAQALWSPGTYRVTRNANGASFGVDLNT
jgi:hypothetical protein